MTEKKSPDAKLLAVTDLADTIGDQVGVRIVDIKYGQQGKTKTLEITIYRPDSAVSHDDCEQVSRLLDAAMEEKEAKGEPVIDGLYMLEVQSPGIDRHLKTDREYRIFAGHKVQIESKTKIEDLGHNVVGILLGLTDGKVKIAHAQALASSTKAKPAKVSKKIAAAAAASEDSAEESDSAVTSASDVKDKAPGIVLTGNEICIDQKAITQIKLFAPDLQPKTK